MHHLKAARSSRVLAGLTTGLLAAGLLTACGSGKTKVSPPPSSSPSPTASPSPSDAADRAAVLDAYTHFWDEQVKALAQGSADGTDLEKYSTGKAAGDVRISIVNFRDRGVTFLGAPKHTAQVESIDVKSSPKTATIRDCLDVTDWKPVDKKTGQPKKVTNRLRYIAVYNARTVGTDWQMTDVTRHQDQPC
ncbi:hypothetical protein AB0442_36230 [Kitasatospora sp. NPDC085895]|uniref:hypothetical protein n=1 Tax=Kitasatospora sp. NPDC085895 TaxID=3155057 RepID=UPI00344E39E5